MDLSVCTRRAPYDYYGIMAEDPDATADNLYNEVVAALDWLGHSLKSDVEPESMLAAMLSPDRQIQPGETDSTGAFLFHSDGKKAIICKDGVTLLQPKCGACSGKRPP